ncbi:MAG: aminotransferase class IV [Sphingobacteriales bacterium]|nr:aminotransferase class IV [Sphingobacteriales bacterium]
MERAFLYGDLLFETLLVQADTIPHLALHYKRLSESANLLKMELCGLNEEKFYQEIRHQAALFRSQHPNTQTLRARFVLYRESEGFYLPNSKRSKYQISLFRFEPKPIIQPLHLGIYREQAKAPGPLSNLKTGNALVYVMASIWAKENNLDDALILNTNHEIIEASSSNIFWLKNGMWHTPPLSSGCVNGIGRSLFMQENICVETTCTLQDLQSAEQCVLTNALQKPRPFSV